MIDTDNSGTITFEELKDTVKRVGADLMESEIQELLRSDGQIDYGEFVAMMRKGNGSGGISRRTMRNTLNFANWKVASS
ncbi:hypothetical protein HID58_032073 [Brassica napus]|uniref:EF-hand domain-containing protein n=1 Tax=Brassica napus TaxID=3708 RepID=A0ABQ8BW82_BRANA|nr:hypothetical protein HID58_032064 [Brassica napus]KAH0908752.1 hypothetical protein HID58_032073 [Brassica napus]